MGKLLYISDLDSNPFTFINKVLDSIESSIDEIVLHYAYQIPANTLDVIKKHDEIKKIADEKLRVQAANIENKTGIKTKVNLSLGTEKSTLLRVLSKDEFDFVLSHNNQIDKMIKKSFPTINFIGSDV